MNERVTAMLAGIDFGGRPRSTLEQLCLACSAALNVAGAGVALIVVGEHRGSLCATDELIAAVEELQYMLGEGPCLDAHRTGRPVLEPDLAGSGRWPAFGPAATEAGIRAVYAFPLQIGAARFGALDLYRSVPGSLTGTDRADAMAVADIVTSLLLHLQADAAPGALPEMIDEVVDRRVVVSQAAGMVSVQLGVAIEEAHVALRARAFADGRPVGEVAADVVARRVTFEP